jgi:tetratricopeptide (TPR) repeat protein
LCWFNAGVCAEEIGNVADALNYYQSAVDYSGEFLLVSHALFSIGRIKDASGDCTGAAEAYQKLVDGYEGTTWAKLAQSRLIDLKADGLIE